MSPIGKAVGKAVGKITSSPAHDVLRAETHPLDPIFAPQSVALIGASERPGSVGRTVLWNLLSSPFGGTIFPVNTKRSNVLGMRTYPSVQELPELPDLVVVSYAGRDASRNILGECADLGVPARS